jgi:hypothetical protein
MPACVTSGFAYTPRTNPIRSVISRAQNSYSAKPEHLKISPAGRTLQTGKPASQQASKPASKPTRQPACQQASQPARQQASRPARVGQPARPPASQQCSQQISKGSGQQASKTASKQARPHGSQMSKSHPGGAKARIDQFHKESCTENGRFSREV